MSGDLLSGVWPSKKHFSYCKYLGLGILTDKYNDLATPW